MGIDIGSTNLKCVLIDPGGRLLGLVKTASDFYSRTPEGKGFPDGEKLFQAVARLCNEALAKAGDCQISGLAVAGVGASGILLDERNEQIPFFCAEPPGDPMPGISDDEYRGICGYSKSYSSAGRVVAQFLSERPDMSGRMLSFMSVSDYINFRLTGVKKRDLSTAGSVSLLNRRTGTNWLEFLALHGTGEHILPPICQSGDYIGDITLPGEVIGLPAGTPVFAGGHDYLCAAFAAGCIGEGDVINVLGTFEMLASFTEFPHAAPEAPGLTTFVDYHVYPGRYGVTAEMLSAGHIERLFNQPGGDGRQLARLFKELDALSPSRLDWEEGSLAAAIVSLNAASVRMFDYQRGITGEEKPRVKVVGGGGASRFWLQNKANVTGLTFIVPRIPEAAAVGAALLAGVGCGIYPSHENAARVFDGNEAAVYSPDPKGKNE